MNTVKRKPFLFSLFSCIIMVCLAFAAVGLSIQTAKAQAESASFDGSVQQTASLQDVSADLNFSLYINNGEQEYRVSALSKSLTEAIIPSHYNGLPVTEIADSGFMACRDLEYVFIPTTVKRVGNNAFMNDTKLKRVVGMPKVTIIGNNAFALCSSLEYLILPGNLTSLGQNVIRNTINPVYARASAERMTFLNPNWNYNGNIVYGNEIVYSNYTNDQGVNGYEIAPYQIFLQEDMDLTITEPLTIYSWCYKTSEDDIGAPLLNIAEGAFAMSTVPYITIKHPENSNLSHTINIESDAFSSVDAEYINIEVDISLNKKVDITSNKETSGESTGVFYGSNFQSITLPDSLNAIPARTFGACVNLTEIKNTNPSIATNQLSDKILTIGDEAFNNTKLPKLYIQNTIEYIGNSAFNQWGSSVDQLLSIDVMEEDADNWGPAWRTGINEEGIPKCIVDFTGATSFTLELIVDQTGVSAPTGNSTLQVDRNATLNDITISSPLSVSHNFTGVWYTTEDRISGTEFEVNEPIKRNLILYAGWEIKNFELEFPSNKYLDFKDINDNILTGEVNSYHYGEIVTFFITLKDGYKNPTIGFNGETLTPNTGNLYTITITQSADFTVSAELIEYSITYANLRDGINPNTVTTYTIESSAITFANPTWAAYNNGTWDVAGIPSGSWGNKTITAIWSNPVSFLITYANLRSGTNPNTVTTYTIESATINFAAPEWEAYDGRAWDITSIPNGSWGDKTITAVWTNPVIYTISYTNLRSGTNPNTITFYTVESPTINFAAPEWEAYNGRTWDLTSIPSGSWGNKTIAAIWSSPVEFKISYLNLQSGTNPAANPIKYTIETPTITFVNPTWEAYRNGVWDTVRISNGSWGDKTITAIWSNPVPFTITYTNLQGGTHTNNITSYNIDSDTITFANPTWGAYYNGTWDINSIPSGSWGNKTIVAVWTNPVPFTITYKNVQGGINPSTNPTTYNVETATITFAKPTWEAYNSGTWNTLNLPKGSWGNKTITAIWSNPVPFTITYDNLLNGTNPSSNPTTYTIDTPTITFSGASRPGYPNCSWSQSSIPTGSWGNVRIRAVWGLPYEYRITYVNLLDGTNPNTRITYTVEDYVTFANPTRYGYLGSWSPASIPQGSTGDQTITAVWTYNMYELKCYAATYEVVGPSQYLPVATGVWKNIQDIRSGAVLKGQTHYVDAPEIKGYSFKYWQKVNGDAPVYYNNVTSGYEVNNTTTATTSTRLSVSDTTYLNTALYIAIYEKSCVATGTLITLADGSQKAVELLTGNEKLLVWNLHTGTFDEASILFIDSDDEREYEVINLYFSDGTSVKVITEHAFWDFDLNQYVFLRNDASQYIGHWFNKQITDTDGNLTWTKVQLVNVIIQKEVTTAWSPVTYGHLCYYVNGMLSMPGATEGLINIFEVNTATMKYNEEKMQADIAEYGLFTYEEFTEIYSVPEIIFEAFGGQYLKVAIGKGLLSEDMLEDLITSYAKFFDIDGQNDIASL